MRASPAALIALLGVGALTVALLAPAPGQADAVTRRDVRSDLLDFSQHEIERILAHGPWPVAAPIDPGNRVSGRPEAMDLGERLFFDRRLSGNGQVACATCHVPERRWIDGKARAEGIAPLDRNTPHLANLRLNRWFGWDGAADSLWAQSIRPILDARELGASAKHVADLMRGDRELACRYTAAVGEAPSPVDDEPVLVNVAKALAAFQETLYTGRAPFDDFRDALARGDTAAAAQYPIAAQRGLRIFVGKGACAVCHTGPNFTNGEFHDIGIPYFTGRGKVDAGRYAGIKALLASPFNALGRWNDDRSGASAIGTRHVALHPRNWGEFRTPSLRNGALTAPYMHNGSIASLREVVRHYSELDEERLHADGERILKRLGLSEGEIGDLVVFLETLTNHGNTWWATPKQAGPACP